MGVSYTDTIVNTDVVRVRTWQTSSAAQKLFATGVVSGDGRRVDKHFKPAYQWLCGQMRARGISGSGSYPLWVWVHGAPRKNQVCPGPEFCRELASGRKWCFAHWAIPEGETELELRVDADRLLVTDYNDWHSVLNNWYLPSVEEQERMEVAWEAGAKFDDPEAMTGWEIRAYEYLYGEGVYRGDLKIRELSSELREELWKSWERCVIEPGENGLSETVREQRELGRYMQATLWNIRLEDVVRYRTVEQNDIGRLIVSNWKKP